MSTSFSYTLVPDQKVIGHCSQPFCKCMAFEELPEGCLNFTPLWKKDDAMNNTMSNTARAAALVENWSRDWSLSPAGGGAMGDLVERITKALSPPVPPDPRTCDRWCVIGVDAYQREWFPTLGEAIAHGGALMDKDSKPKTLLAVKAEAVIERTPPPPVQSRALVETDFLGRKRRSTWPN